MLKEARVSKFFKKTLGENVNPNNLNKEDIKVDNKVYQADVDFLGYIIFKIFKTELSAYVSHQNTGFVFIRPAYEHTSLPLDNILYKDLVHIRFGLQHIDKLSEGCKKDIFDSKLYYTINGNVEHIDGGLLINWCIVELMFTNYIKLNQILKI